MPERLIGPVSKTGVPSGTAGSNPALSVAPQRVSTSSRTSGACGVFSIVDCPVALKSASSASFAASTVPANDTGDDCHAVTMVQATGAMTSPDYTV